MQIILLSGGSGQRLWPLTNDARSKQFLPLLEAPDGKTESMIQRVVRQITTSQLDGNITIATNETQQDIIQNQLGQLVEVVKEPERRGTFPAIALACSYLSLTKQCNNEEPVIVMPSDTYAEDRYFDALTNMVKAVENDVANLILLGIRPTHPTTQYGYIVPENEINGIQIQGVKYFVEKPDQQRAEELLTQWAYWNGGVFAFRLGFMKQILEQYIKADSFEEVLHRYRDFPRVSFDCEIVEKASSVAVVPFSGKWKDLGTWTALTEELHHHTIGNVVTGTSNENTHVINESDLPIFCDGLKNIVVASSPDGILVCGKESSKNIKIYAKSLAKRPMYEERRWGTYQVLKSETYQDGTQYLTKSLRIHAGKFISYQIHKKRKEIWTITEGKGIVVVEDVPREVNRGDVVIIEKEQKHCIKAITELEIIEVQLGTELIEGDIIRFDWKW